jgi:Kef-type K+ transport system membrane component KefB
MHGELTLLQDMALGIIFAVVAGHIARFLKQPLLLGYIGGGILLSHHMGFGLITNDASVELISEIGLILLLFIIGLEMNPAEILRMGRPFFVLGVGQFVLNAAIGFLLLRFTGIPFLTETKGFEGVYLPVVLSLSSTLIVVKLLQEKLETKTIAGKLTLGVLIFQDIWAILFMAAQPNLSNPEPLTLLKSAGAILLLGGVAYLFGRYILSYLFTVAAGKPELVLLTSMAYCFFMSGVGEKAGLSREMGSLVAGISMASFPYGHDVISKLSGIRDFFITLFFVSLGMKLPLPGTETLWIIPGIVLFIFFSRMVSILPLVVGLGHGIRTGVITSLNLSQISEFSLVILSLGLPLSHISQQLVVLILTALMISSLISTYVIQFNDSMARSFVRLLPFGKKEGSGIQKNHTGAHDLDYDILILGNFRIAQAFIKRVEEERPDLKNRIMVVDFHVHLGHDIIQRGFQWAYGDLAHPESLSHLNIGRARIIVSTVSDTFLKGITSIRLLGLLKNLSPSARIIMTGESPDERESLIAAGADHVLVPGEITASELYSHIIEDDTVNNKKKSPPVPKIGNAGLFL